MHKEYFKPTKLRVIAIFISLLQQQLTLTRNRKEDKSSEQKYHAAVTFLSELFPTERGLGQKQSNK